MKETERNEFVPAYRDGRCTRSVRTCRVESCDDDDATLSSSMKRRRRKRRREAKASKKQATHYTKYVTVPNDGETAIGSNCNCNCSTSTPATEQPAWHSIM